MPALAHCGKVGSPPQVRGKPRAAILRALASGITPAGAGKTQIQTTDRGKGQGSPPQVRGKHAHKQPFHR